MFRYFYFFFICTRVSHYNVKVGWPLLGCGLRQLLLVCLFASLIFLQRAKTINVHNKISLYLLFCVSWCREWNVCKQPSSHWNWSRWSTYFKAFVRPPRITLYHHVSISTLTKRRHTYGTPCIDDATLWSSPSIHWQHSHKIDDSGAPTSQFPLTN